MAPLTDQAWDMTDQGWEMLVRRMRNAEAIAEELGMPLEDVEKHLALAQERIDTRREERSREVKPGSLMTPLLERSDYERSNYGHRLPPG